MRYSRPQPYEPHAPNLDEIEVFTEDEAARILRISKVTLWRERKKGRINYRRSASRPVYLREDLENYLKLAARDQTEGIK